MAKEELYNLAKTYVSVIEQIEKTADAERLVLLEEYRASLHNQLIDELKQRGIPFRDRNDVTRLAYLFARTLE